MSIAYECQRWARAQQLKGPAKMVLVVLSLFVNDNLQCWPSYETLAAESGLSIKTVQRAVHKLEQEKFIEVRRGQYKNSNLYTFPKSYPQRDRSERPYSKKRQVKLTERQVTQSRETGHCDLLTPKNSHIESFFNKNEEVQKMYKSNPSPLGDILRQALAKKKEGYP